MPSSRLRLRVGHWLGPGFRMGVLIVLVVPLFESLRADDKVGPVGTDPLLIEGDIASEMIDGIDRFLLKEIKAAPAERKAHWKLDFSSSEKLQQSLVPQRLRLAKIVGTTDARISFSAPSLVAQMDRPLTITSSERFDVFAIRWPVFADPAPQLEGLASLWGEGLMLVPRSGSHGDNPVADVIVLPDADQTPEQLCGLTAGIEPSSQVARRLAQSGCRVIVPQLISRSREKRLGRANLTHREYLNRPAFVLGRTLAGYEIQTVLGLFDWLEKSQPERGVGLFGYGEGGMLALLAAGIDPRIQVVCVSGFFGPRDQSWQEPNDRNFFGMLEASDAAELAMLVAGRQLIIETAKGPELTLTGEGGTPAQLRSPDPELAGRAIAQVTTRLSESTVADLAHQFSIVHPQDGQFGSDEALRLLLDGFHIDGGIHLAAENVAAENGGSIEEPENADSKAAEADAEQRERRLIQQIDRHNQAVLNESHFVREEFVSKLDTSSLEAYVESSEPYRAQFRDEIIGHFDQPLLPPGARSRKSWETDTWIGYEIQLDVFPDVFAYGVLLLPKDLKPNEKRPVIVCQHGLEGRPIHTFLNDHRAYHDYAAKLCDRGFIVFAPQNPYIFEDRFRTLQRKAQPLGKTLFSIIVPQHQQIVNWLKSQPFTDPDRIAFYGLSYGGKTAMRVPALVTDYCLSICSADFNEWVLKNASSRHKFSYLWTGEYEIFEWNLGNTFNYAEMAALICPRPFMVERGHFDAVGDDHWVAFEYAKVRNLYAAKLGIGERTEIDWFVGPHTINGQATFDFLHRHLQWPQPSAQLRYLSSEK
jgi:dienelactone hydrolase